MFRILSVQPAFPFGKTESCTLLTIIRPDCVMMTMARSSFALLSMHIRKNVIIEYKHEKEEAQSIKLKNEVLLLLMFEAN